MKSADMVVGEAYAWKVGSGDDRDWVKVVYARPASSRAKVIVRRGDSNRELDIATSRIMCKWSEKWDLIRDLQKLDRVKAQDELADADEAHCAMLVMRKVAPRADSYGVWQVSTEDMDRLWSDMPGTWKKQRGVYVDMRTHAVRVPKAVVVRMARVAAAKDPDLVVRIESDFRDSSFRAGMGDGRLDRWLSILRGWASGETELAAENAVLRRALDDKRAELRSAEAKLEAAMQQVRDVIASMDELLKLKAS